MYIINCLISTVPLPDRSRALLDNQIDIPNVTVSIQVVCLKSICCYSETNKLINLLGPNFSLLQKTFFIFLKCLKISNNSGNPLFCAFLHICESKFLMFFTQEHYKSGTALSFSFILHYKVKEIIFIYFIR